MDFTLLIPEIIVALTALFVIGVDLFLSGSEEARRTTLAYIAAIGLLIALAVLVGWQLAGGYQVGKDSFFGAFLSDNFSWFFRVVLLISGILSVLLSIQYVRDRIRNAGEFYALMCLATLGGLFMVAATEMLTLYLALELLSISSYVLVGLNKDRILSTEAAIKYLVFGALSSGFLLYGMSLVFGLAGDIRYSEIFNFFANYQEGFNLTVLLAVLFMLGGMGYKLSAVPFHMWTPDVYQGAPLPITAFISSSSKIAGFAAFLRLIEMFNTDLLTPLWVLVVTAMAVLSMVFGNLVAIAQKDIKRLFAYSSIAQGGYLLVGVVALSEQASRDTALIGLLYYLFIYVFMNLGAFAVIIYLSKQVNSTQLNAFAGLGHKAPWSCFVLSCCLLSLTGLPPFAGFTGKFYLFGAVVSMGSSHTWLALVGVLASVISLYYYIGIIKLLYFAKAREEISIYQPNLAITLATIISFIGIVSLFIYPLPIIGFISTITHLL